MTIDQLKQVQIALKSAEQRILASNRDRPIDSIRHILDQIKKAREIVHFEISDQVDGRAV